MAARTSSAAGVCTYQRARSATISFAAAASSGLGILRVTVTKNSCRTWMLTHPSRVSHRLVSRSRARSCLTPAVLSYAYTRTLVSMNWRLSLMQVVPVPVDVTPRAEIDAVTEPGKASLPGTGVPVLLLDQISEHPGKQRGYRRSATRGQHPRLAEVLFGKGQCDVLVAYIRPSLFYVLQVKQCTAAISSAPAPGC